MKTEFHSIDTFEVRRRAQQMRAEATRDMAIAFGAWLTGLVQSIKHIGKDAAKA